MPRIETYVVADDDEYRGSRYVEGGGRSRRIPRGVLIGGVGIGAAVILMLVLIALFGNKNAPDIAVTITSTPGATATTPVPAEAATEEADTAEPTTFAPTKLPTQEFFTPVPPGFVTDTPTLAVSPTDVPTNTPTATVTWTSIPPTETPTITNTVAPTNTPEPSQTPTNTATVTLTPLPPQGVQGEQDLLALLNHTPNLPYNPELFSPVENGWRMGTGVALAGDILYVTPPPDLLETAYGNNAATRIRRVEADMTLVTYNPSIVTASDVFFGILLESATDGSNAGMRLQVVDNNVITLTRMLNNESKFLNQRSVNTIIARLRIDRDVNNGQLSLYFNDIPMGDPFGFLPPDTPLIPVLFVKNGGVVVGINSWKVTLR